MSVLLVKTTDELTALQGTAAAGDTYFNSDTKDIYVSDGTGWRGYQNDGVYSTYPSNSYSASFDGNDYITGNVSALNSVSAFSASCWFRYQGSLGDATHIMLSGAGTWYVWLKSTTAIEYGSQATGRTFAISTVNDSTWYHLATVHDGSNITLYLNGSSLGTTTIPGVPSTAGNSFNIGRFTTGSYYWNGYLDEVALFNRAITSSEVSDIYSNKSYKNLTALYRLENGATDEIGNYNLTNNDATFVAKADNSANTPY